MEAFYAVAGVFLFLCGMWLTRKERLGLGLTAVFGILALFWFAGRSSMTGYGTWLDAVLLLVLFYYWRVVEVTHPFEARSPYPHSDKRTEPASGGRTGSAFHRSGLPKQARGTLAQNGHSRKSNHSV